MNIFKLMLVSLMVIFSLFGTISAQCGWCNYPDDGYVCGLQKCGRKLRFYTLLQQFKIYITLFFFYLSMQKKF